MTIEANWHPAKDIFVAEITASGTGVVEDGVTYYPHAWVERELSTTGRGYGEKAGARTGTVTSHPAFTLDGTALDAGTMVFMRQRGWVNATSISGDVYDIVSVSVVVPGSSGNDPIPPGGGGGSGVFSTVCAFEPSYVLNYPYFRWSAVRWDTGNYLRFTDPNDSRSERLYAPDPGWYMVGANVQGRPGDQVYIWANNQLIFHDLGGWLIAAGTFDRNGHVNLARHWYFPTGWYARLLGSSPNIISGYSPGESFPGVAYTPEFWMYQCGVDYGVGPTMPALPLGFGNGSLEQGNLQGGDPAIPFATPEGGSLAPRSFSELMPLVGRDGLADRSMAMGGMMGFGVMGGGSPPVIFPNEGAAFLDYTGTPAGGSGGGDFSISTVFVPPPTWEDFISISSVLPGTYRVTAILTATAEISSTAPAWIHMRIYNSTGSAALGNPARIVTCHTANDEYTDCATLHFDFTITATSTIKLQVKIDDGPNNPTFTTAKILNSGDDVPTYFLRRIFDDE